MIDSVRLAGVERPVGLLLIGSGPDRGKIERTIAGNPHIRVQGPERDRERLATIMASADALIHGCESETFGMVAAEAVASGLPLIVPDNGGARDFGAPDRAEHYRAGDPRDAALAIGRLLARDLTALHAAAKRAASHVPSMSDHFATLFDTYASIIADRAAPRRVAA